MNETSPNILIVEARFYEELADEMAQGAEAALTEAGARFERLAVPGAFEIPGAIAFAARAGGAAGFHGFVALGCVIRGETTHYDYVCQESARGLMDLSVRDGVAIGYGILTCENREQAWARAARDQGDKGRAAVDACLRMVALRRRFAAQSA
jgi:6,7-dimethyl-8-ribityllumazine synthase